MKDETPEDETALVEQCVEASTRFPSSQEDLPPFYKYHELSRTDFWSVAKTLKIGVHPNGLPPKDRVRVFFERYGTTDLKDYEYTYVKDGRRIRAVLKCSLLDRVFGGGCALDEYEAKAKVWEVFSSDEEILRIAPLLPPSQTVIRAAVKGMKAVPWKDFKEVRGLKHGDVIRELVHYIFLLFRDMGCRTAVWDGRF